MPRNAYGLCSQAGSSHRTRPQPVRPRPKTRRRKTLDLERLSKDQIATLIGRKFRGHEMARLVDAVLKAQGYTTFVSPPGPDKGVDILAAPGPLGFGKPRICIQVKSQDSPVDSPTLNQLIGSMFNAMLLDVDNGPAAFTASDDDGP